MVSCRGDITDRGSDCLIVIREYYLQKVTIFCFLHSQVTYFRKFIHEIEICKDKTKYNDK